MMILLILKIEVLGVNFYILSPSQILDQIMKFYTVVRGGNTTKDHCSFYYCEPILLKIFIEPYKKHAKNINSRFTYRNTTNRFLISMTEKI